MWQQIRLESLGVIDSAELELGPGFTVVTGETGAGKTMVVTALGLLRGGRSDAALVRHGARRLRVEASVDVTGLDAVRRDLEETSADVEEGTVILARTVTADGRSRAHLGGSSVPAGLLGRISDRLVAVHGQSDQHRLLRPDAQRSALDRFAGAPVRTLLDDYRPAYARLRDAEHSLEEIRTSARERARELDLLLFGLGEIEATAPVLGEEDALLAEEDRLAHAEALSHAALSARELISSDLVDPPDVVSLVSQAQTDLGHGRDHDPELDGLGARLDEIGYLLNELSSDLGTYAQGVEVDPQRLAQVQGRRADLATLTRKYGPSLSDVLDWSVQAARRAEELASDDEQVESLALEVDELTGTLLALGARLSAARAAAAADLGKRVSAELEALAMPHARLEALVRTADAVGSSDLGPFGVDQVELLLAANAGVPPLPLAKGASGGELSRVMLALEVVLADETSVPTFVFDEVDAGIGGRAAVEVGRRLAMLARHAQVIAVTHLPQVAAFADRHYVVVKADDGTVTTSGVVRLDDRSRVGELSRMLAGLDGSASAEAHAQELLDVAASDRGR